MNAEFHLTGQDYGLSVDIHCTYANDNYTNQAELREAINRLLSALRSWERVNVEIKTVEAS